MDNQKRWNRYCKAINYCIDKGYFIIPEDSKGGNVKAIKVGFWDEYGTIATIPLKPKRYTGPELFQIIYNIVVEIRVDDVQIYLRESLKIPFCLLYIIVIIIERYVYYC